MRVDPLGFQHDLMMVLVCEFNDLIFDGWTIPRPDTLDLTAVERRTAHISADDVVDSFVRLRDVAAHPILQGARGSERKRRRFAVPFLRLKRGKINRAAVQSWRRSRLQTPPLKPDTTNAVSQSDGRRLAVAACR